MVDTIAEWLVVLIRLGFLAFGAVATIGLAVFTLIVAVWLIIATVSDVIEEFFSD